MSAPTLKRPAPSGNASTPVKSVAGNDKINVVFKFRPSDWYVGVECTEQSGFNPHNEHRMAFNAVMRELVDCGGVVLISKKYDPALFEDYKFGYGNIKSSWTRTQDPLPWVEAVHAKVLQLAEHVKHIGFKVYVDNFKLETCRDITAFKSAIKETERPTTPAPADEHSMHVDIDRLASLEARVQELENKLDSMGKSYVPPARLIPAAPTTHDTPATVHSQVKRQSRHHSARTIQRCTTRHYRRRTLHVLNMFSSMGADIDSLRADANRLATDDAYYRNWVVDQTWISPGLCCIDACGTLCPGGVTRYAMGLDMPCHWCMSHMNVWAE